MLHFDKGSRRSGRDLGREIDIDAVIAAGDTFVLSRLGDIPRILRCWPSPGAPTAIVGWRSPPVTTDTWSSPP